ncbi:MAG: hypothetical protein HYS13_24045 [Planctomycetia bacterium]|nr:hypothetical protein [Planctomycetia bacterium]
MTYHGHVVGGNIILDPSVRLPDGAEVEVRVVQPADAQPAHAEPPPGGPSIEDEIAAIWADVPESAWAGLPHDLTDHLDYYLYGTPKE